MAQFSLFGKTLMSSKTAKIYQQVRTGYIVLLPEVNPHQTETNPLFKNGYPDVENLTPEKCINTLGKYLLDFEHSVREVESSLVDNKQEINFINNVVEPLEESGLKMDSTWGLCKALYFMDNNRMPPSKYLVMHNRARKARSMKYNSKNIYSLCKSCDVTKLTEEEHRVVDKFLIEGKLNGLDLSPEKQAHCKEILLSLAKEKDQFRRRTQVSSRKFKHSIHDPLVVQNFPKDILRFMSQDKVNYNCGPWDITLSPTVTDKVLSYCPDRSVRWNTWLARRQVASGLSGQPSELNNSATLEKIRLLRRDLAKVLGYESFAHVSMETKMASLDEVQDTLNRLLEKAKLVQNKEIEALQKFASKRGFTAKLEMWDIPYWEREHKIELYQWDDIKIREYFTVEKVFQGLMDLTARTFDLKFEKSKIDTWHPDVVLYHIFSSESSNPIAGLYVDLYSRKNKLVNHDGITVGIRPQVKRLEASVPLSAIVFNFARTEDGTALISFSEVENLFKKFGSVLQQLISHVNYSEVSGLSNIEWDAVDVVSNFMYLWLKDANVLKEISGHYKTGETLPFVEIEQVRKHMFGYHLCQEIYLSNLDLQLHTSKEYWGSLVKKLWKHHFEQFKLDQNDAHPLSFTTCISEELSCAYYSRIWSRMLAEDAYNTFKSDPDRAAIGSRFRDTFLGFGGACHPSEVFRRFQGRDPSSEAFEALLNDLD